MFNTGGSSPAISDCSFNENKCGDGGNGGPGMDRYVLVVTGGSGNGGPGGEGGKGGGVYNTDSSSQIVRNCTFSRNKGGDGGYGGRGGSLWALGGQTAAGRGGKGGSGGSGGGIYSSSSNPHISECEFRNNESGSGNNGGNAGVNAASFIALPGFGGDGGNGGIGGGICFNKCSSPDVNSCAFFNNETGSGGLAGRWAYAGLFTGIQFIADAKATNGDAGSGGGISSYQSSPVMMNCMFRGNIGLFGGGIYSSESNPTVTNCTFTLNLGKISGGGERDGDDLSYADQGYGGAYQAGGYLDRGGGDPKGD